MLFAPAVVAFIVVFPSDETRMMAVTGTGAGRSTSMTTGTSTGITKTTTRLGMGLYDNTPLPPRPEPGDGKKKVKKENDDQPFLYAPVQRLFAFQTNGKEKRDLLPPLSRPLESGISCYLERSDRLVQNLVSKTACHPEDAAWALEACKGDSTEAWTRIVMARRTLFDIPNEPGSKMSAEVSELMAEDDLEIFKEQLKELDRNDRRNQFIYGGTPDEEWLPGRQNAKPIDEEPWFTG